MGELLVIAVLEVPVGDLRSARMPHVVVRPDVLEDRAQVPDAFGTAAHERMQRQAHDPTALLALGPQPIELQLPVVRQPLEPD